jgi:SAM-dependent methyltransferase
MLRVARGRLGDLRLIQADVSAAELGGTYDAIVCLFSAIAYAETPDHLADALRNLADHLRPGGVLVVDGWISRADWQAGFVNVDIAERGATKIVRVSHSSTDGDCSVVHFHFVIASPGDGIDATGSYSASGVKPTCHAVSARRPTASDLNSSSPSRITAAMTSAVNDQGHQRRQRPRMRVFTIKHPDRWTVRLASRWSACLRAHANAV